MCSSSTGSKKTTVSIDCRRVAQIAFRKVIHCIAVHLPPVACRPWPGTLDHGKRALHSFLTSTLEYSEDPAYPRISLFAKLGGLTRSGFYHPGLAQMLLLPALAQFFGNSRKPERLSGIAMDWNGMTDIPIRSADSKAFFEAALPRPNPNYPIPLELDVECRSRAIAQFASGFDAAVLPLFPIWRLHAVQETIRLRRGIAAVKCRIREQKHARLMQQIAAVEGPDHSWHLKLLGMMRASHLPEKKSVHLAGKVSVDTLGGFGERRKPGRSRRKLKRLSFPSRIGIGLPRVRRGNLILNADEVMELKNGSLPPINNQ